jgi:hypothetical protein
MLVEAVRILLEAVKVLVEAEGVSGRYSHILYRNIISTTLAKRHLVPLF